MVACTRLRLVVGRAGLGIVGLGRRIVVGIAGVGIAGAEGTVAERVAGAAAVGIVAGRAGSNLDFGGREGQMGWNVSRMKARVVE